MLRDALVAGEPLSPLHAWERWRMNSSTYHRCIWEFTHREGLAVHSHLVTEPNGVRHSVHWIAIPGVMVNAGA